MAGNHCNVHGRSHLIVGVIERIRARRQLPCGRSGDVLPDQCIDPVFIAKARDLPVDLQESARGEPIPPDRSVGSVLKVEATATGYTKRSWLHIT